MKMKKALSIILGGALLVGSSSFIFANDAIKLINETQEQPAVSSEVSLETTETEIETEAPKVTIDVLDELINNLDSEITIDLEDEELEEELLELIEDILEELEEEAEENESENNEEVDEDEEIDEEEEDKELTLENLHRNLLKYQLVYDRVPAQAKPAIEKNMKKMQLKILGYMVEMNVDLNTLCSEVNMEELQSELSNLNEQLESEGLTEEGKQELMNTITSLEKKISNHEEMVDLITFVSENENWEKELKNNIHQEFKAEKAKVKAESKIAKEEIKLAKKELQAQMKAHKKVDKNTKEVVISNQTIDIESEIKVEIKNDDKKDNEKIEKKSHPVKENHPGKGNGKKK